MYFPSSSHISDYKKEYLDLRLDDVLRSLNVHLRREILYHKEQPPMFVINITLSLFEWASKPLTDLALEKIRLFGWDATFSFNEFDQRMSANSRLDKKEIDYNLNIKIHPMIQSSYS